MKDEIKAPETNQTWSFANLPLRKNAIGCKWIYRIKYNFDGTIESYMTHLVAKENSQIESFDFTDVLPTKKDKKNVLSSV